MKIDVVRAGVTIFCAAGLAAAGAGCGSRISGVAAHTLRSGPDKDTDVVWVTIAGELYRCEGGDKPRCVRVDGQ